MWWLAYRFDGVPAIVIVKAASQVQARLVVSVAGLDAGATFVVGHELDARRARQVPKAALGKLLGRREAEGVLKRLDAA